MLKTGKPSERSCFTFDKTVEILRELKEPNGVRSTLPNHNVSFRQSRGRLGFAKSMCIARTDAVTAGAIESYEDMYFENRKKRPQERGRKKRRKGKWDPLDRLWNSANSKNCSSEHLFEQD